MKTEKINGGTLRYATTYTVVGCGSLTGALDMMRRDRSSPLSGKDSSIIALLGISSREDKTFQLIAYHENKKWEPLIRRGESFGFKIQQD